MSQLVRDAMVVEADFALVQDAVVVAVGAGAVGDVYVISYYNPRAHTRPCL